MEIKQVVEWPYIKPEMPAGPPIRETAQRYLAACCAAYGSQTVLARLCKVPLPYINRLLRQDVAPTLALAEELERVLGIPRDWWRPEETRLGALSEMRRRQRDEAYPGQLAGRCGLSREDFERVLRGELDAPEQMRALGAKNFRIPWAAWDR